MPSAPSFSEAGPPTILRLNDKTADGQVIDGYQIIPDELKLLHCEDFRDDAQYQAHLQNLIASLNAPVPPLGKLIGVPSLPAHYLSRTDRLIPLRDAVRSGLDTAAPFGGEAARQQFHGIAGTSKHVGVHGMGGIGKSVLANLLAHDREIRKAFPDGIVWVGLGSVPILADLMRRVPDPDGATPFLVFGPFENAHGPLVDDKILAFNMNCEAFWFQIRRRKGS